MPLKNLAEKWRNHRPMELKKQENFKNIFWLKSFHWTRQTQFRQTYRGFVTKNQNILPQIPKLKLKFLLFSVENLIIQHFLWILGMQFLQFWPTYGNYSVCDFCIFCSNFKKFWKAKKLSKAYCSTKCCSTHVENSFDNLPKIFVKGLKFFGQCPKVMEFKLVWE